MPQHDHCCVPFCRKHCFSTLRLSFHSFPSKDLLRAKYIQPIRREEGEQLAVTASSVVCWDYLWNQIPIRRTSKVGILVLWENTLTPLEAGYCAFQTRIPACCCWCCSDIPEDRHRVASERLAQFEAEWAIVQHDHVL